MKYKQAIKDIFVMLKNNNVDEALTKCNETLHLNKTKLTQKTIASRVKTSPTYINKLVKTKSRPNWKMAKKLTIAVPGTSPVLWLEGTSDEIKAAIKNASQTKNTQETT